MLFFTVTCSTDTKIKCQAALSMLRKTSFFSQKCSCEHPTIQPECTQIQNIAFKHPCLDTSEVTSYKKKPNTIINISFIVTSQISLPTCLHSKQACDNNKKCTQIYNKLFKSCMKMEKGCPNR